MQALDLIAETQAEPNSYGFRPKRSTADALEKSFNIIRPSHCFFINMR